MYEYGSVCQSPQLLRCFAFLTPPESNGMDCLIVLFDYYWTENGVVLWINYNFTVIPGSGRNMKILAVNINTDYGR